MAKLEPLLDAALLLALGRLVATFNYLEQMLVQKVSLLLVGVSGEQQKAHIVTSYMSFNLLVEVHHALCRHRLEGGDSTTLDEYRKRLLAVEQGRNRYVHSLWVAGSLPGTAFRVKRSARRKSGFSLKVEADVTAHKINEVADEAAKLSHLVGEDTFQLLLEGVADEPQGQAGG